MQGLTKIFPNVVIVDDGSFDETSSQAFRFGATVLPHVINLGQGAALQTGIEYSLSAGAQIIVTFDADGQHHIPDIEKLVTPILNGESDIVLGSRFLGQALNIGLSRKILLQGGILFTRVMSGVSLTDTHNGFRAFSRRAARRINITMNRMAHASELIDQMIKSDYLYTEVPVRIKYTDYTRKKGQQSMDVFRIIIDYILGRIIR